MPHKKHAKPLSDHTVAQLRKMASRAGVKQVTPSGDTKNKSQLVRSLQAHKKH